MPTESQRLKAMLMLNPCICGHGLMRHDRLANTHAQDVRMGACRHCECLQYQSAPPVEGPPVRTDRIYIADESHIQSIGRGDLGTVYQLLKDLEWSQSRNGCQLHPGWVPITARCCVACSGVQPSYFQPEAFPKEANGHTSDCRLLAAILTLRAALGAIE